MPIQVERRREFCWTRKLPAESMQAARPADEALRLKDLGTDERIAVFLSAIYGNNACRHHMSIRAKQVGNQLGEDVICVAAGRLSNSSSNTTGGH